MSQVDSVQNAASTPDQPQPSAALGLTDEEYAQITDVLGRRPTAAELAMYAVMWAEHASYKSSRRHLSQFGQKTTAEMRETLLVGIGQNAGVVDIGDGWAASFKVESHNSPSFLDPFRGAATGVGGIVRDIVAMGARPVAVMSQLRAGAADHPDTDRIVTGAIAGVSSYARGLRVPVLGGETELDPAYQSNPLVNVLALGLLRHEEVHLANASGAGNRVVLFGARTGRDGIGAAVLSSSALDKDSETRTSSVPAGDPELERRLIGCCLELFAAGSVQAIQDLGAAGISCATTELAANGGSGMHVDLDSVPLGDDSLTAEDILMSETQERMMAVVEPDKLDSFLQTARAWEVEAAVIGELDDSGRLTIDHDGHRIVDVDPQSVADGGPVLDRPHAEPSWQADLVADAAEVLPRPMTAEDLRDQFMAVVRRPDRAGAAWAAGQVDPLIGDRTVLAAPDDAGIVRVDESGRGVAITADCNGRFARLDPYAGAQLALAESYRNVATAGARPLAVSDCLNFGNPEEPGAMWQLVQAITGLADGCNALGVPVTGGNVSLYNATETDPARADDAVHERTAGSIHPTPVVAMLGVIDDVSRAAASGWAEEGLGLYLLGRTREELSGSQWSDVVHEHLGGTPPTVDFAAEQRLADVLLAAHQDGLLASAHDLSDGGLAQALTDGVLRFGIGARIELDDLLAQDGIDTATALFSESTARAIVSVPPASESQFLDLLQERGQAYQRIGTTRGSGTDARLDVTGVLDVPVDQLAVTRDDS